jgi:lysozyme
MKATEGVDLRDKKFDLNWKESAGVGLVRGAYHFFRATEEGAEQAKFFIEHVDLRKGDLPPVLDVEHLNNIDPSIMRDRLQACLDILEKHYGVRPIIYTNADFYKQYLIDSFDDYPLWVAHYLRMDRPGVARPWHFWQHSESGHVNGILSKVDFNVFSGDAQDFQQLLIP